ncbi:hypothetical protein HELRODRAFT_67163 [Helobdella robusta]|uniref:Glutathione S-transferase 3, mitochondrial n=1 Tax=Helobdella robusta TaxID=6412 RepID=T1FYX6_HELRO|nr:hypothetical protein HELRODRAFT_67163 [Helobdella robusta]ESN98716.1 hypothetical protein HELRODRAFT_67163 [Helobdella robusta]
MPVLSKCITVPDGYGYVVLAGIGHVFLNTWLAMKVVNARKKYKIEYPTMYSADNQDFNCIQRAHQNTLENYPTYLFLLLVGGLQYPKIVAGTGAFYIVCRIIYAKGYYTGEPKNRIYGAATSHIAEIVLLGSVVSWAFHELQWVSE